MHSHPDMRQPDKIPECTSYTYSQFPPGSSSQSHLRIEMPVLRILSAYTGTFLHPLPVGREVNHMLQKCVPYLPDQHILPYLQCKNLTASVGFRSDQSGCLLQDRPLPLPAFRPQYNNDKTPAMPPHAGVHPMADCFHNVPGSYPQASGFPLPTIPLPNPWDTWSAFGFFLPERNISPGSRPLQAGFLQP